jgi:hypothetical protein
MSLKKKEKKNLLSTEAVSEDKKHGTELKDINNTSQQQN